MVTGEASRVGRRRATGLCSPVEEGLGPASSGRLRPLVRLLWGWWVRVGGRAGAREPNRRAWGGPRTLRGSGRAGGTPVNLDSGGGGEWGDGGAPGDRFNGHGTSANPTRGDGPLPSDARERGSGASSSREKVRVSVISTFQLGAAQCRRAGSYTRKEPVRGVRGGRRRGRRAAAPGPLAAADPQRAQDVLQLRNPLLSAGVGPGAAWRGQRGENIRILR